MSGTPLRELSLREKTKRFFAPIFIRKKIYTNFFISSLFVPLVGVIVILFLEKITHILLSGSTEDIKSILIYFLIFIIFSEVVIYATKNWGWMVTLYQTMDDLYTQYFRKYIILDNTKVEKTGSGKLVGIIYEGVFRWSEIIADLIIIISALGVGIIFTMFMVYRIHPVLPIVFLFLIFLFCLITYFMNKKLAFFRSERYEYKNLVLKEFVKIISNKNEILQTGKLEADLKKLSYYLGEGSRISMAMSPYRTINKRAAPFLLHISLFFLFIYISYYFLPQGQDISFLVGLSGTFVLMQKTIGDFVKFYVDLNKQMVSVEKLWDFFDTTPEITGYETGNTFIYQSGNIELQNLSYGYEGNKNVFENFDLKIIGGKVTAFVGPSGGGKSTLVKLIAGYLKADSGDIFIDGQKLSETSLKSYYQDVGYLTQEPSVFDGTVRENLMYAITGEEIKEKKLQEIISLAHCEFIYDLPQGLDTEIGERGVKLSGGQKQRLAIAKIFLKNPKIIILDEPTSALDSLSEKKITEAMHNLFQNRTVLVIAHRLQTVKYADDIIVIDSGKIIERGNHQTLVQKKGYYAEMLELQSGF